MTATTLTERQQLVCDAFRFVMKTRSIKPRTGGLINLFFGPGSQQYRADMASIILERKCNKSSKEAQFFNWRQMILDAMNVESGCLAARERAAEEIIWNEILGTEGK